MASVPTAKTLTTQDIVDIKLRLRRGDYQHDIAADYGLNQGRISEINTGKRGVATKASEQPTLL